MGQAYGLSFSAISISKLLVEIALTLDIQKERAFLPRKMVKVEDRFHPRNLVVVVRRYWMEIV